MQKSRRRVAALTVDSDDLRVALGAECDHVAALVLVARTVSRQCGGDRVQLIHNAARRCDANAALDRERSANVERLAVQILEWLKKNRRSEENHRSDLNRVFPALGDVRRQLLNHVHNWANEFAPNKCELIDRDRELIFMLTSAFDFDPPRPSVTFEVNEHDERSLLLRPRVGPAGASITVLSRTDTIHCPNAWHCELIRVCRFRHDELSDVSRGVVALKYAAMVATEWLDPIVYSKQGGVVLVREKGDDLFIAIAHAAGTPRECVHNGCRLCDEPGIDSDDERYNNHFDAALKAITRAQTRGLSLGCAHDVAFTSGSPNAIFLQRPIAMAPLYTVGYIGAVYEQMNLAQMAPEVAPVGDSTLRWLMSRCGAYAMCGVWRELATWATTDGERLRAMLGSTAAKIDDGLIASTAATMLIALAPRKEFDTDIHAWAVALAEHGRDHATIFRALKDASH